MRYAPHYLCLITCTNPVAVLHNRVIDFCDLQGECVFYTGPFFVFEFSFISLKSPMPISYNNIKVYLYTQPG